MKPVLIVKAGEPVPAVAGRFGGFEDWILAGSGLDPEAVRTVAVYREEALPDPTSVAGVIVTGSKAMVTDHEPWMERAATWLRRAVGDRVPVLGICFGHQLLAHALGGEVGDNPRGREIGTVRVRLLPAAGEDPLLAGFPARLTVQATHTQSVLRLPPGAVLLAANDHEPHHAFRAGKRAWGLQFHPEITAGVMRAHLALMRSTLAAEGLDPAALEAAVESSPAGPALLRRFVAIARADAGREVGAFLRRPVRRV